MIYKYKYIYLKVIIDVIKYTKYYWYYLDSFSTSNNICFVYLKKYYLVLRVHDSLFFIAISLFHQQKMYHNFIYFFNSTLSHLPYSLLFFFHYHDTPTLSFYISAFVSFCFSSIGFQQDTVELCFLTQYETLLLLIRIFYPVYIYYWNWSGCFYFYHSLLRFLDANLVLCLLLSGLPFLFLVLYFLGGFWFIFFRVLEMSLFFIALNNWMPL